MKMSSRPTAPKDSRLVVGGESRAYLLPPEVTSAVKDRSTKRALIGVVAVTSVVVMAASGFAFFVSASSASSLAAEQQRSTELIGQQTQYAEVRSVKADLAAVTAARAIGAATEVDWGTYYAELEARLPEGVAFSGIAVESATPLEQLPQAAVPLQGPRVVTVTLDVSSPAIIDVTGWLDNLATLPGFVDVSPKTVSRTDGTESFAATVVLHLDSTAYWNRYAPADAAQTTTEGTGK